MGLMRTHHSGPPERGERCFRISRAAVFCAGETLSSRSKMIASAVLSSALAIFFSLSAGTNSQLRGSGIGLFQEQRGAGAFAHQLVTLVEAAVCPSDDTRVGPRLALPDRDALGLAAQGVPDAHRIGELECVIAQVGDERAARGVGDAD